MAKQKASLLGRKTYKFNDDITIIIPTIREIRGDNEETEIRLWKDISLFTETPSDAISELDSMGLDFTEMSEYTYFMLLFSLYKSGKNLTNEKYSLFLNFNLWNLNIIEFNDGRMVLADENGKTYIDEVIYNDLSELICYMFGREKTKPKKFGNEYAKKKRIERDYETKRKRLEEIKKNGYSSFFDGVILRLVCNSNFPYNFETIQDISIFDLLISLKQIEKDVQVTDLMQSRLVGNDLSKLPKEQLSRFIL